MDDVFYLIEDGLPVHSIGGFDFGQIRPDMPGLARFASREDAEVATPRRLRLRCGVGMPPPQKVEVMSMREAILARHVEEYQVGYSIDDALEVPAYPGW